MGAEILRTEVLVIGSGAGGAATAATLAARGYEVVILEEGPRIDPARITTSSPEAIARMYRGGGLTPILGRPAIAYVEGRCVGGSTEVNSAFWHRLPEDCYARWRADVWLTDFSAETMRPYFETLERELSVSYLSASQPPASSELFRRGIERMGWQYEEIPRCQKPNDGASPFAPGNKQSMQQTYIPKALNAGASLLPDCRALRLVHENGRVHAVQAQRSVDGTRQVLRIEADSVFVCCGAVQTAALLRRSGIRRNVGDNLRIHPMLKAAALFDDAIGASEEVLPIYQVKEFWPNITIGGSVFTPGFLAMLLSDNWGASREVIRDWERMALYYTATRGMNRGTIRVLPGAPDEVVVRYAVTEADRRNLSTGLGRLGEILFAAGARAVYPSLRSRPVLKSAAQCRGFLAEAIPAHAMSLSTVHAFSSCPMGENPDVCATDSFGRVHGFRNLHINDASLIPDSPGVNPQGAVMAIALRNVDHFDARNRSTAGLGRTRRKGSLRVSQSTSAPSVLITGAPGWLGTRLVEALIRGLPGVWNTEVRGVSSVRCLVHPAIDPAPLSALGPEVEVVIGDLGDPATARALCSGAAGAVLFHAAGVIHPQRGIGEFERVNVEGTRSLLQAATDAGVRRVVAVSSNSPFGFNSSSDELFDERSPYAPYGGYGRSKQRMELIVKAAQASGRIESVIIRAPWFYGPQQPVRQTLFFKMIRNGRFPVLGDGSQRRSMVYVDHLCQGLLLAGTAPRASGEAYWIADERPYSILEIVETVRDVLEEELGVPCARDQLRLPAFLGDFSRIADGALQAVGLYSQKIHVLGEMGGTIACSVEKAKRELGYAPTVSLREGMTASVRWCLARGIFL